MESTTNLKRKAQQLAQSGAYAEAAAEYTKIAQTGEMESYDLVVFGDLLNKAGLKDEAVNRYLEALTSYEKAGLTRNAIALAKKIQRMAPEFSVAHRKLGDLYSSEGLSSEACLHYLEYLERVDKESEDNTDDIQDVCTRLLSLSLPSFEIVEPILEVGRAVGCEKSLAIGVMHQARRAAAMGNSDAESMLTETARKLDPQVLSKADNDPGESEAPEPMPLDPGALPVATEEGEDTPVLSLDDFSYQEADPSAVNLDGPAPGDDTGELSLDEMELSAEEDASLEVSGATDPTGQPALSMDDVDLEAVEEAEATAVDSAEFGRIEDPDSHEARTKVAEADEIRTRGIEHLENGDVAQAQRDFMKAARLYFEGPRSHEAAKLYKRVVLTDPNHLEALRGLVEIAHINGEKSRMAHWGCEFGDVLLAREMYGEAKVQFERVLAFDAKNAKALSRVKRLNTIAGVQGVGFGELAPAASEVDGAQVTIRDDEPEAGQSMLDLSQILDEFRAAVVDRIPSDDAQSHYDLGVTYKEMGLIQEAAQELEIAAGDNANRSGSLEMLGECYLLLNRHEDAIRVLEEVLVEAAEDEQARTHVALGQAREGIGDWDKAEEEYYRALELDEDLEEAAQLLETLERRREQGAA